MHEERIQLFGLVFQLLTITTANTSSRLGTCSGEIWTVCAASTSVGPGSDSSTAASEAEDLERRGNAREEDEERERFWEEKESELKHVLLKKENVGDGCCFVQILGWVARDEHKERVTEAEAIVGMLYARCFS